LDQIFGAQVVIGTSKVPWAKQGRPFIKSMPGSGPISTQNPTSSDLILSNEQYALMLHIHVVQLNNMLLLPTSHEDSPEVQPSFSPQDSSKSLNEDCLLIFTIKLWLFFGRLAINYFLVVFFV